MPLTIRPEFDVVLSVQPEEQWLPLIDRAARIYLEARGFPAKLVDHCLAAIGEAVEQMISLQIARGLRSPFELGLVWEDEAVGIHFMYPASVPLNPHRETEYEVPAAGSSLADVSPEGLWLHMIKRTMDRVFFRLDGARRW